MRRIAVLCCCLALSVSWATAQQQQNSTRHSERGPRRAPHRRGGPTFKVSAFKDVTAYVLTQVQENLQGVLDVQLKWVANADEAHADLRSWEADVACMSYDDTLSLALQENYTDVVAAWPMHGSMMNLCGTIDVPKGLNSVGIDTDTGYARMLRQQLQKSLSPADYAALRWVYAGATNLRYVALVDQQINATLLNPPFTAFVGNSLPCDPFYTRTGPIQGSVGNVHASALRDARKRSVIRVFFEGYKRATLDMRDNKPAAVAGLASYYNVTPAVAEDIWGRLWGVDGLSTSFCFEPPRLNNSESIFAQDTGIAVPRTRWWVRDFGCQLKHGRG